MGAGLCHEFHSGFWLRGFIFVPSASCLTSMADDSSDEPEETSTAHIPFANAFGESRALREVTCFLVGNAYPKYIYMYIYMYIYIIIYI